MVISVRFSFLDNLRSPNFFITNVPKAVEICLCALNFVLIQYYIERRISSKFLIFLSYVCLVAKINLPMIQQTAGSLTRNWLKWGHKGVHEKNLNHLVIKDITVVMNTFIR